MKQTEPERFDDVFRAMLNSGGNSLEFDRHRASSLWNDIVGITVANVTTRRYLDGDVLHVFISSGPVKSELAYVLPSVLERINDAVGRNVIKRIIIH